MITSINSARLGRLIESFPTDDPDQIQPISTALANLLALPTTPGGTFFAAHISQGELHWGLQRAFELLAASQNLVLVFEDLHWSEPTLFEFIQSLVQSSAPILVLRSVRPEGLDDRPPLAQDDGHRVARLAGLTDNEASMLLVRLTRATPTRSVCTTPQNGGGQPPVPRRDAAHAGEHGNARR